MAQLVIANGVVVRLIWARGGLPYAINVLGAENTGAVTINQAFANTLGTAIKSLFSTSGFAARVSTDVTLANIGVRSIAQANQAEFIDTGAAVAGTDAGDPLPASVSLVVTLRTANAGPSYRGRIYLPGFTENSNDTDGSVLAAASTAAVTFIGDMQSVFTTNGLTGAVLSRPRDAVTIPARTISAKAGFLTQTNAVLVRDLRWDTQRRRLDAGV